MAAELEFAENGERFGQGLAFLIWPVLAVSASKMSAMPITRACTDICSRVRPFG